MKGLAKPISSPSRVDSFPPPLLRFLKSNGSSRSRGRCRSSPIFIQKKKREANQGIVTQEPSSPKVTCMGQVRVRRSKQAGKKNRKKKKKNNPIDKSGYQWIQKTLFCCHFNENLKPKTKTSKKPCCGKWVFPISRKKLEIKEESTEIEANIEDFEELEETTEEEEEEEEKAEVFIASSPPKNALLLMRCRSEPYRASSLANQFWGSPSLTNQEEEDEERECKTEPKHIEDEEEEEKPTLEKEPPNCRDSAAESRINPETEEKMGFCQGFERSSSITSTKTCTNIEAETSKIPSSSSSRPLLLTRCKSEPARRSENFQVETCFWKRRFEFVDLSTTRF